MGRRILNRKDLRADYDAAERRKGEEEEDEVEDEEEGAEEEAEGEADAGDDDDEDDDGEPKPKKKKAAKPAAKAKPRTRTVKVPRLKAVWAVFDNSNRRIATYDYAKKKEAEEHRDRLQADKKSTHFIQMLKETMDDKKD